ncbi:MAG: penicillin-binding protein activator [Sphingomonas fennica]
MMAEALRVPQWGAWGKRATAIGLAALLAACSTVIPRSAPPVAGPAPAPRPVPQGPLPEDAARNRVALLVPLTGANAAVGRSIADAANLALADTGGKAIRLTTYDTAAGALPAAQRALAEGNRLFLGPLLADDVRAVAAAARGAGVPVVAFSNDAAVAGDGVYILGFLPAQSIDRVVRFARSKGMTRLAGLMPAGVYGRNASAMFLKAAEAAGGEVVAMRTYDRSAASLTAAAGGLPKGGYDAVMIADSGRIALQAAPLVKRNTAGARLLGTELWAADRALAASPALAGAWYASVDDGMFRQLSTRYRARYGRAPFRLASLGYDAVLLTVRIAANWKTGDRFPAGRLTDADGFAGVDGAFRFGRDGIAVRALAVSELGANGISVVSPAPASVRDGG